MVLFLRHAQGNLLPDIQRIVPRIRVLGRVQDRRTGTRLCVVNVHLDFRSARNRLESARLVAARLEPWLGAREHVILAGDLNALAGSPTPRILTDAGLVLTSARGSSFHVNRGLNLFGVIDHILHDCATGLTHRPVAAGGQWPSDNYPVLAQVVSGAARCVQP